MGSVGNQNPLSPYDNYRDCSLGVCSIYCPQFCYLIFPPPPPSDDDSGSPFSPLIIAIIGVLASAFLLVSYYTIVTKYCNRRRSNRVSESEENLHEVAHHHHQDQWQQQQQQQQIGLDEALIDKITVCKYKPGEGLIEGTDCAVCLSEFQENESLRLLPKCSHAFHLPCIDAWLKSHSNCPLCRANVVALASPPVNLSSYQVNPPVNDLVLVVDSDFREQVVVIGDNDDEGVVDEGDTVISISPQRQQQQQLLISDILKFEEIEEYVRVEIDEQMWRGIGSSKETDRGGREGKLLRSPMAAMRRSVSNGRFVGRVNDKGKNAVLSSIP